MKQFLVHSCHLTAVDVPAKTAEGLAVVGRMPVAIVELVPVDGIGGTLTETISMQSEVDAKRIADTFPVGGIVTRGDYALVKAS